MMCRLALRRQKKEKKKKNVRQLFAMRHHCNNTDVQVPFIWLCREIHFLGSRESKERERVHEFRFVSG